MSDVLDNFAKKARDHARVPMQVGVQLAFILPARTLMGDCILVGRISQRRIYDWHPMDEG
jgi:hypothetical protein